LSRFYIPRGSVKGKEILVSGEEAHHILDVMRLKQLDKVTAFDGEGSEYSGFIKSLSRNSLIIEIISEIHNITEKEKYQLTLIQAIPKKDKMDYIVEKATELGVSRIIPVISGRTIVRWDEDKRNAHSNRWRVIAKEAAKQCGRTVIPQVDDIEKIKDALSSVDGNGLKLIAALADDASQLKDAVNGFMPGQIAVAIGPEGDFTPEEIKLAKDKGFKVISLGKRVLKSDTAGLAAIAALDYEFDI